MSTEKAEQQKINYKLIHRVFQTLLLQGGTQLAVIVLSAVLARNLNPTEFGEYSFGLHFATLIATLACMGSATTLAKSWGNTTGDIMDRRKKVFQIHNFLFYQGMGIVIAVVILFMFITSSDIERVSFLIVFSLFIVMQQNNYFVAIDEAPVGNTVQLLRSLLALFTGILSLYVFQSDQTIVLIVCSSTLLTIVVFVANAKKQTFVATAPEHNELRIFTFQHWASVLLIHADILLLRLLLDSESIAIYSVAMFLSSASSFGLYAINANTMARIADGAVKLSKYEIQKLLKYYAKIAVIFSALFLALVMLVGQYTGTFLGPFYEQSYFVFLVLTLGQIVNVLCGSVALILNIFGHSYIVSKSISLALFIKVAISFALVPNLGLWGVAIGAAISMIFWNLFLLYQVLHHLGLNPTIFPITKRLEQ